MRPSIGCEPQGLHSIIDHNHRRPAIARQVSITAG